MTVGQYLLLAAVGYVATGFLCYLFIYKPAKSKINERYFSADSEELEPDTEFIAGRLYRVEGHQVLVVPAECELSVSRVKIRRHSGALIIYPREQTWADYPELQAADADFLQDRPDVIANRDK